ncbi:class I SAM-dependent methyltransferase [Thermocladium modestius]|nr:class I SAM-dependent methyltransferase [Thermocladium modestius]
MGIGYRWRRLYPIYGKIAGVYDRTSRVVTLFLIDGWRRSMAREVARMVPPGSRVLDAGAGPGTMSVLLLSMRRDVDLLLIDQSIDMIRMAPRDLDRVVASFEEPPLRDSSVDAVIMGFSLHASHDLATAVNALWRVLRPGGVLGSINIGHPDGAVMGWLGHLYTLYVIPFLAFLVAGRRNASYFREINTIYDSMPPNSKLRELMESRFRTVRWTSRGLGTVFEYVGIKA